MDQYGKKKNHMVEYDIYITTSPHKHDHSKKDANF